MYTAILSTFTLLRPLTAADKEGCIVFKVALRVCCGDNLDHTVAWLLLLVIFEIFWKQSACNFLGFFSIIKILYIIYTVIV